MFFSTFPYVLRHISEGHMAEAGVQDPYVRALQNQLNNPTWPSFKTLHAARHVLKPGESLDFYELGATLIHQARCRAAGAFLRTSQDVWVSCDEDVEAGEMALSVLVEHVEETRGVAFAAYRLRGDTKWSVGGLDMTDDDTDWGDTTLPRKFAGGAGAGLYAVHRDAIANAADQWVKEPDGSLSPLLFEVLAVPEGDHYAWRGEDIVFCQNMRTAEVPMHVFFFPDVTHDGIPNARHLVSAP